MAFTKFTVEGDAILGYFASEPSDRDRAVRIKDDNTPDESTTGPEIALDGHQSIGNRVENLIARSLDFPSGAEFDEMSQRMEALREQELQPADGTPDITREGLRLRITVEVID